MGQFSVKFLKISSGFFCLPDDSEVPHESKQCEQSTASSDNRVISLAVPHITKEQISLDATAVLKLIMPALYKFLVFFVTHFLTLHFTETKLPVLWAVAFRAMTR